MQNRLSLPLGLSLRADQDKARLRLAHRSMVEWAKVDDHSAILDMDCVDGSLLNYYCKCFHIRACGIAADKEQLARSVSLCGGSAEILRASRMDIPWQTSTFHVVFLGNLMRNCQAARSMLTETRRVLKAGGQLLALAPGFHLFSHLSGRQADDRFLDATHPQCLMKLLEETGYEDISMRVSSVRFAVVVAHKPAGSSDTEGGTELNHA